MFKRGQIENIQPGRQFRPPVAGLMVSTARVLTIGADAHGIPHVHFQISFALPSGSAVGQDTRILSLERFAAVYSEPVGEPLAV
jgi:hypothetical protein